MEDESNQRILCVYRVKISTPPTAFILISPSFPFIIRIEYIAAVRPPTIRNMSTETSPEPTKAGVSSPEELRDFVSKAGSRLLVVDVRNPDATVEPGDVKSLAVAGFPDEDYRPQAVTLTWNRETNSMEVPTTDLDTPIITHCGGGGRGQMAKDYLLKNGFTNVMNGGGPKETACWAEFGSK